MGVGTILQSVVELEDEMIPWIVQLMTQEEDHDDNINFDQFLKLMKRMQDGEDFKRTMFKGFDEDGNGLISAHEMKIIIRNVFKTDISEETVEDMINEADMDGDGQINYEEFSKSMQGYYALNVQADK